MAIYQFEGRRPDISEKSYVDKSATIIGDVTVGDNCYVAPGARIKGDYGKIKIGDNSNIQENCVVHARPEEKTVIGDWVTVGHGAIIHGGKIDDYAIIGMGSIVSDEAKIGRWSVVGEGAVVKSGQEINDEEVAVGIPSKTIKQISNNYKERWKKIKEEYASFSHRYKDGLDRIG